MSVIGRLDKQVEEVLISPLDRDRRSATAKSEAQTDENAQAYEPTPAASGTHQNIRGQREKDELPVWLL
jgi:hypothetical protein